MNDKYQRQARLLKIMGNGSRLAIVERLGKRECTAGELTELVGADQSTVSKHLALLRAYGIVSDRREGSRVYYRLSARCVLNFLGCSNQLLRERER